MRKSKGKAKQRKAAGKRATANKRKSPKRRNNRTSRNRLAENRTQAKALVNNPTGRRNRLANNRTSPNRLVANRSSAKAEVTPVVVTIQPRQFYRLNRYSEVFFGYKEKELKQLLRPMIDAGEIPKWAYVGKGRFPGYLGHQILRIQEVLIAKAQEVAP